ncbi:5'-nucleotidase C-terminal domain-containing protein [Pseudalkalibacillus salsuginis]|uniref:5'-nucleotidase C-terminal domain-containing protein n=1 Tax=Pseudalkalibacillus salsuginis TaxID=2910972 RepID=UPI001F3AD7A5|nr:5'-nucleotidase C-terminal domain-containing protein [Pseudalkalibacillus salsuginis]MCF6411643.1 5'-nucleotidase C-terminal domain-containing protein [Pseudalkalibacillus salsuginis]
MYHQVTRKWTTLIALIAMLVTLLPMGVVQAETTIPISEAKTQNGQTVTVEGVVTADFTASNLSAYIQDDSAGINIFNFGLGDFPDLVPGQQLQVTGKITSYNGLTEIKPTDIQVLSEGNELPEPHPTDLATLYNNEAEPLEGSLVNVTGYIQSIPSNQAGGGYNISFIDDTMQGVVLRVEGVTDIDVSQLEEGKWYNVTAVIGQYNDYQLLPTKAEDLRLLEDQPPAPQPEETYEATVERVVDGDTVRINDPVLGATNVRMLSIDTPETNYNGHSQGEHAEAATAELQRMLPAGTEITLEVGEEPLDSYGRLLAHVHKGDMDVNKEMVRLGRAVPYFIYPNMEHFEAYSSAAEEAIENGRGIWDPDNPIEELPYEFRFNLRNGPDKFVGDYFTKEYVTPEKWEDIPVQNRVFFFEEQDATGAGYTAADDGSSEDSIQVQLLGVNDLHGKVDVTGTYDGLQYGRMDYLSAYLKEREATSPNTLIVHSGDMVGASSPVSALLQDEPTVHMMEEMGFDVGTVGNHEFDEGVDEMLRLIDGGDHSDGTENYDGIDFPMVAANVEYKDSGDLVLDPYTVLEIGGTKIGFIGIVTTETPSMVIPDGIQNVNFTDEAEAVNRFVPELQEQGVEAIVVLAHEPGSQSGDTVTGEVSELARNINDAVDVIFAAHNHVKVNAVVDGKLIVQAWEYGKAFADVDLEIDPVTNDIVHKSAEIVDVVQNNMEPDPVITGLLDYYDELVGPKLREVVGEAAIDLEGGYASKGLIGDNALGNLIAEGMRVEMGSDFALMNGGGIRDDLDAGEITWGELYNIQPFGNTLVQIDLTGDDLRQVLNAQFSKYGPDVSIAGFRYTWNEETWEVMGLYLPDGTHVDPEETYTVVVNNYMYPHGTDNYRLDELGENPVQGPNDLDATINYIQSFEEPIEMYPDARISNDYFAPTTTVTVDGNVGEDATNEEDVTFTVEATDNDGIGILRTEYRVNEGEWVTVEDGSFTIFEEGTYLVEIRSIDKNFNREEGQAFTVVIGEEAITLDELNEMVEEGYEEGHFSNYGIYRSIQAKISSVQRTESEEEQAHKLESLQDYVEHKSGKHIDEEFAQGLINAIDGILETY